MFADERERVSDTLGILVPEVGEDGCDHARIGDDGEYPHCCAATRAAADIDVENAAQTLCLRLI